MQSSVRSIGVVAALVWTAAVVTLPGTNSDVVIRRVANPPALGDLRNLPGDLAAIAVPTPANLGDFVRDEGAARVLGKALFWDMQVGSDGIQACATCHFRAGADPRSRNQVSPGLLRARWPRQSLLYASVRTVSSTRMTFRLRDSRFRAFVVSSIRATDSNDVVSSQGVHHLGEGPDPLGFAVDGLNTRRVEPRNTPTVINAVFNHRQFWDGRAEAVFNGVNHLGSARPGRAAVPRRSPELPRRGASGAGQREPGVTSRGTDCQQPRNGCAGTYQRRMWARELARTTRKIFKRIQALRPLAGQQVHPTDSHAGTVQPMAAAGPHGAHYDELIKRAFHERWWRSSRLISVVDGRLASGRRQGRRRSVDGGIHADSIQLHAVLRPGGADVRSDFGLRRNAVGPLPARKPV